MKIAITGAQGQIGNALQSALKEHELILLTHQALDISDPGTTAFLTKLKPDLVIHTAAMTNVEGCAQNEQLAYLTNSYGTQNIALACLQCDAEMVYISTNEVFNGKSEKAYHEFDRTDPINPYAKSKCAGEKIASRLLHKLYIVRTAWVFAPSGNNFPSKVLQLSLEHETLKMVEDEVASPSFAPDIAKAITQLIKTQHYGNYHFTNEGICSRYAYALEILQQAGKNNTHIEPIPLAAFPRVSTPPKFTPLQNNCGRSIGIVFRPWQEALADYFDQIK